MTQILRLPFDQWPEEVFSALHNTLKKFAGDNVNVNTRPVQLLSALYRIQAKRYASLIQLATAPSESGCRQDAGFTGFSAHALRRMLHTMITESLAVRGDVTTMFPDFSGAFDEINKQAILRVAEMYPFFVEWYMKWYTTTCPSGNTWLVPWAFPSHIAKWRVFCKGGGI